MTPSKQAPAKARIVERIRFLGLGMCELKIEMVGF
jgi:hypothetical protein